MLTGKCHVEEKGIEITLPIETQKTGWYVSTQTCLYQPNKSHQEAKYLTLNNRGQGHPQAPPHQPPGEED
jgi:hypothetical protein